MRRIWLLDKDWYKHSNLNRWLENKEKYGIEWQEADGHSHYCEMYAESPENALVFFGQLHPAQVINIISVELIK